MTPELSRADLLRLLANTPQRGHSASAGVLGWACDENRRIRPPSASAGVAGEPDRDKTQTPLHQPVRYLARRRLRYWRVVECRPLAEREDIEEGERAPGLAPANEATRPPADQAIAPLLSPGQWQNLWDRLPPRRCSARAIDVERSVAKLARAEPVRGLPRKARRGFNRAVTLILDRPQALRPVWDDMRAAKRSLQALLGDELQGFHLPTGPDGVWLALGVPGLGARDQIPGGALVVLIGAFGALETGEIGPAWRALLEDLRASGHDCLLVPVCPLRSSADPVASLDPSISRGTRAQTDRTLQALLAALSQTWFPTPARLRRLRQAIPGAGLHVELLAYNDPSVIHDDFHLNLRSEQLLVGLHRFRDLDPELRASLRKAIVAWRAGLDLGAQDIERLQGDLLSPRNPGAYPQLERQAALAAAGLGRQPSMVFAQFCSMLPMIRRLVERGVGDDWKPLLRNAERVALATRRPPPSDADRTDLATPTHTVRQRHKGLTVVPGLGGLLDIGAQAYSPQTGQWVQAGLPSGLDALEILNRGYRWRLHADPCPAWAQRAWVDTGGLFAAHAEGAVYAWTPASPERSEGRWEPRRSPWGWAADTGVDEHGLWATLRVRDVSFRLRWIPPGEFLMGSPDDEDERADDETLHQVRLARGFWLGETSVTQAFWQAVTGSNPSHFRGKDLPVEQVSWDDCQAFLDRLKQHLPGFRASLPSEAQWEYACRAGTRTRYWWGAALDETRANNGGQTRRDADYPANGFGLRSMSGNVYEWCTDWYGDYPEGQVLDPAGPAEGESRMLRGGAWYDYGRYLRSAYRFRAAPDARFHNFGVRLAGGSDPEAG